MADNSLNWNVVRDLPNPGSSADEYSALTDVPIFLGFVISFLLQGILVVQIFIYFVSFSSSDPRYIKMTVTLVFFLDCLSSVFAVVSAASSIVNTGYLAKFTLTWGFRAIAALCGIVTLIVQCFYSWRIHLLDGHWILLVVIILLSMVQCGMVMYSGFTSVLGVGLKPELSSTILSVNIIWLLGSAICDLIISLSLLVLLRRTTAHLSSSQTKSALRTVMTVAIETGMLTAIGACIELVFYLLLTNSFVHFIMFFVLPKLYANCMLATLNARLDVPGRRFRESSIEWLTPVSAREFRAKTLSHLEKRERTGGRTKGEINEPDDSSHMHAIQHHRPFASPPCRELESLPELPNQMIDSRRMTVCLPVRNCESWPMEPLPAPMVL